MFGPLDALVTMCKEIYNAIPENKQLKVDLEQKNGHIKALDSIIKTKECNIDSITQDCITLKNDGVKLADDLKQQIVRKQFYKGEVVKANQQILKAKKIIGILKSQVAGLACQMESLAKQEGKFWETPPSTTAPAFRARTGGHAEIIAVTNLKGGVGKTTLTANLGATLWSQGKRVLLVDLDYQRTLTNLTLPTMELRQLELAQRFVDKLFREETATDQTLFNLAARVGDKSGYLIAAREELADVEEHVKAQWLLQQTAHDARFLLRQVLHSPAIQKQFDVILLDCPPRLTLASINALACCDHVLIPVVLDKASTRAVPRLLRWLKHLHANKVTADLNILGIVPNLTFFAGKYANRESNLLSELLSECEKDWQEPVYAFKQGIPRKAAFAKAAETKSFAAFDSALQPVFRQVTKELNQRLAPSETLSS